MPADAKAQRVIAYANQDCGNLIRCALAVGCSAGARDAEGVPAIYWGYTPLMDAQSRHTEIAALLDLLSGQMAEHPPGVGCDQCCCVSANGMMMTCIGCNAARYCTAACAALHWRGHKAECERLVAAREEQSRVRIATQPQH